MTRNQKIAWGLLGGISLLALASCALQPNKACAQSRSYSSSSMSRPISSPPRTMSPSLFNKPAAPAYRAPTNTAPPAASAPRAMSPSSIDAMRRDAAPKPSVPPVQPPRSSYSYTPQTQERVIERHYDRGSDTNGFFNGMLMGTIIGNSNQPAQAAPVIINNGQPQAPQYVPAPQDQGQTYAGRRGSDC